jgi:hypothetical protein
MKQPMIVKQGLLQSCGNTRLNIPKINFGPPNTVIVTGPTVIVNVTRNHLVALTGVTDVVNIFGGAEGDLLILTGDDVRLNTGGNIAKRQRLRPTEVVWLLFTGGLWI